MFEKVVGFKSPGLSFSDLKAKVASVKSDFTAQFGSGSESQYEALYLHWRHRRRDAGGNSLLR